MLQNIDGDSSPLVLHTYVVDIHHPALELNESNPCLSAILQ